MVTYPVLATETVIDRQKDGYSIEQMDRNTEMVNNIFCSPVPLWLKPFGLRVCDVPSLKVLNGRMNESV